MTNKKNISILLVFVSLFLILGGVFAENENKVTVSLADEYKNEVGNYIAEIDTPVLAGLADEVQQKEINERFSKNATDLIQQFESDANEVKEKFPNDLPHFVVNYKFEIVNESSEQLVFRVYTFTAAGSSSFSAEYFTIDQKDRKIVTLKDIAGDKTDYLNAIETYVIGAMEAHNKSDEMKYWVGEAAIGADWKADMDGVFKNVEENGNYYLNSDGDLVIAFNKYDVAPGAMGTPEFIIPKDVYGK